MYPAISSFRVKFFSVPIILAILSAGAFASARGEFERTLKVSGNVNLQVETGSGSIDVRTGSSSEVHVVGHIYVNDWFGGGDADAKVKKIESNPPVPFCFAFTAS